MKSKVMGLLAVGLLSAFSGVASAIDVPVSLIVSRAGLEFAWAAPCAPEDPSCGGTPLAMHDGWNIAQSADFLAGFTGRLDLFNAFGGGSICASSYFNSGYSHCDGVNVWDPSGFYPISIWNAPSSGGWAGNSGNGPFAETFVVRNAVPEPGTLALFGLGLVGLGLSRRRKA